MATSIRGSRIIEGYYYREAEEAILAAMQAARVTHVRVGGANPGSPWMGLPYGGRIAVRAVTRQGTEGRVIGYLPDVYAMAPYGLTAPRPTTPLTALIKP